MEVIKTSFSRHLMDRGLVTLEDLEKGLAIQNKDRLLGSLARELDILTDDDLLRIKEYQEYHNIKFGEAGISLGLLTRSQLKYLLDIRLRRKVRIGDILVREGFISREKLYEALMSFEKYRLRLKKILICEPSKTEAAHLKGILEKYNYPVMVTGDPLTAKRITSKEKPDLLITSRLPEEMSGPGAGHFSRWDLINLRIIFITPSIEKDLVERAFEAGVHYFLKKPVEEYELLNIIYDIEQKRRQGRKEKILIVDDNALIRQLIAHGLDKQGYRIVQAPDGESALTLSKSENPDLITMDVNMPGMDGYETCKRLRENPVTHDIPVIMVTSNDTREERMKGFEAGAVEYFVKPFSPEQLADYIKILFESKKARRRQKALIVEDVQTTLYIIQYILEKQGIGALTAVNGEDALKKMGQMIPDIVIFDIAIPGGDIFNVCHEMKASPETRHIPFILLTSSGKKDDIIKGLALGANDYIVKPFDEDEFMARVNNLLAGKKLYEQLKALNTRLDTQNRSLGKLTREKERFYSMLTHDLRSPLASIMGHANVLMDTEDKSTASSQGESLEFIRSAAERQLNIIDDALAIFQFEEEKEMETEELDLGGLIHDILLDNQHEIKTRHLRLNFQGRPFSSEQCFPLPCCFNQHKITRVMENLMSNAIKYAQGKIDVSYGVRGGFVEVRVRDDGPGIPKKYAERIFEDFPRIPGSKEGTGLGLSSARRIVEAHRGKIGMDSSSGRCTFYFTLPI